jgi:hypothetical protein
MAWCHLEIGTLTVALLLATRKLAFNADSQGYKKILWCYRALNFWGRQYTKCRNLSSRYTTWGMIFVWKERHVGPKLFVVFYSVVYTKKKNTAIKSCPHTIKFSAFCHPVIQWSTIKDCPYEIYIALSWHLQMLIFV